MQSLSIAGIVAAQNFVTKAGASIPFQPETMATDHRNKILRAVSHQHDQTHDQTAAYISPSTKPMNKTHNVRLSTTCVLLCAVLLTLLLSIAACGPEQSVTSQAETLATTQRIALDYQASNNLEEARNQLNQLTVANANQWLLLATEGAIAKQGDPALIGAMVKLTTDLQLQSASITDYATKHSLPTRAGQPATTPVAKVNALPASTPLPTVVPARQVTQTQQVTVTEPVTTAAPVTLTIAPAVTISTTTQLAQAQVKATDALNLRGGPGTAFDLVGSMQLKEVAVVTGKNPQGDWWQVTLDSGVTGWVYDPLVEKIGDVASVAVVADIPQAPAAPVAQADPVQAVDPAPAAEPTSAPAAAPPPASGPEFQLVGKRLWNVLENGGQLNGDSVTCGEKRELHVMTLDANGQPLNGVDIQVAYGAQETYTTGVQGKGDGQVEFVLGGGQDVKVLRDNGRDVSSDNATGLVTDPHDISQGDLIGGRFCSDDTSCQHFRDSWGCKGHYSWTVTFKRNH